MALSNLEYQKIMRLYEERRLANYHLHEERKKEIYQKIPEIREIDRRIASNSISLGKKLIMRDDASAAAEYRRENHSLAEQKRALLTESGYSRDDSGPIYHCSL